MHEGDENRAEEPERIEVEIEGVRYELVPRAWPYSVGRIWVIRLTRVLGGLVGAGSGDLTGELLDRLSEKVLLDLVDTCEQHTTAKAIESGEAVPFQKLTPLLKDRYDVTLRIVVRHVQDRFGPFIDSLGAVLGDPSASQGEGRAGA